MAVMDEIKIDKNVPMPNRKNAKWLRLAKDIQVGDSFFTENFKEKEHARSCLKTYGIKVATRAENSGYRIWCKGKPVKAEYLDD
jgi:hypothetical protein